MDGRRAGAGGVAKVDGERQEEEKKMPEKARKEGKKEIRNL